LNGFLSQCERCRKGHPPFEKKPDTEEWTNHKMTDPSWAEWRREQGLEPKAGGPQPLCLVDVPQTGEIGGILRKPKAGAE
jgi:hypothetical protein